MVVQEFQMMILCIKRRNVIISDIFDGEILDITLSSL